MCSISDIPIVGAALNHISEATVGAVYRGIRYILFYKDNVDKLKSEINVLDIKEQEIKRQVEQAENNGKTIKKHVYDWQDDVKKIKGEVTEFLGRYDSRTSWKCFNVLRCPNPCRRFQLGRWAAKKTTMVSEFSDLEKKQLTCEISYFPPEDYSPISSTEYQNFGSRKVAYEKILEALNYKEDGFPVVGVYGFGGVGKTRMMEEASKEVKAKGIFNTVARANVGQVVDIGKIQDQLATNLNITEKSENRTSQLKARLSKGDTILIILDDVWSKIPFPEIGIPFRESSIRGCKILLTSRLREVCIRNNCKDPVEIEALTEDEAWSMFTKMVGTLNIESVDDSLARKVCNKCARLPLVIAAVGNALHQKDQEFWKDALHQLINCKPENIHGIPEDAYACLRLSFNILDKDAYLCLLLCSLAGEDEDIQIEFLFRLAAGSELLEYWDTYTLEDARNRVDAMVSVLKSSSLLLEGHDYDRVKLHDIIRDVARSITHDKESGYEFLSESNWHSLWQKVNTLNSWKLIYLDFESDNVHKSDNVNFPDDLVCPDIHTLYLNFSNLSGVQLPHSFFESFPKLKNFFLDIESLSAMPSSIQNLDSLRSLTIQRCKVNDISHIIQFKNLEMLSLQDSCFGGLLLDLRQLRRLRMLDLLGCTKIMGIVLSGLVCLEELFLPEDCNILDEETKRKVPLSSVLSKLTSLRIYFEDVKSCPDENFCKNLCRYKICVGGGSMEFWEHVSATKRVYLCNDSIGGGVKTLVERGEDVTLEGVTGLQKCFSQGGEAFKDLKRLNIRECTGDEYLSSVGSFSKLSVLKISISGFKYLFCTSTAKSLRQLEELEINDCKMMAEMVRNEGQINEIIYFPKLRRLDLLSLPAFKSLCGKVVFPALERLWIHDLDSITEIWEEHGHLEESLCQLKYLMVKGCHKLKNVISYAMRQRLQNLDMLQIDDCKMMEEIVRNEGQINEIIDFPKLRSLSLYSLPVFKSFCEKVVFPVLETFSIHDLDNMTEIWEEHGHLKEESFCQLKYLDVRGCHKLKNVISYAMRERLQNLETLYVEECDSLISEVQGPNGAEIAEPLIVFPKLKDLSLCGLPKLMETGLNSSDIILYPNLTTLLIDGCNNLRNVFLPSVAIHLIKLLEELIIKSCEMMNEIIASVGKDSKEIRVNNIEFPMLRKLTLEELPAMNSFWDYGIVEQQKSSQARKLH